MKETQILGDPLQRYFLNLLTEISLSRTYIQLKFGTRHRSYSVCLADSRSPN